MRTVLILGASGQIGCEVHKLFKKDKKWRTLTPKSNNLNLKNLDLVKFVMDAVKGPFGLDLIINCAAYTDVNNAESKGGEDNISLNSVLPNTLAVLSKTHNIPLIHLSTDYVFPGKNMYQEGKGGYTETDKTEPLNEYGRVKLLGEEMIQSVASKYYIIRTSWVYSENRKNFVKYMYEHGPDQLNGADVIMDQFGRPTSAIELAEVIYTVANEEGENYGVYHYGGSEVLSWAKFAELIFKKMKCTTKVNHICSEVWQSPVNRPKDNVLNISKIKETFDIKTLNMNIYLSEVIRRLEGSNS
jgi:dTDP-4-dehydrorhamnose reductase